MEEKEQHGQESTAGKLNEWDKVFFDLSKMLHFMRGGYTDAMIRVGTNPVPCKYCGHAHTDMTVFKYHHN